MSTTTDVAREQDIEIVATEIVETDFGEKVQIDTPYAAKEYIKYMPWSSDQGTNGDELSASTIVPDYEFSPNFGCHHSWNGDAYVWEIDRDSFQQAIAYFQSLGIEVTDETGLFITE